MPTKYFVSFFQLFNNFLQELTELVAKYAADTDTKLMPPEVGAAIYKLAQTDAVKQTFHRRSEFWNLDASD